MPSRSLKDAFKAHPVNLHDHPLDFASLCELPNSFKWGTSPSGEDRAPSGEHEPVPVIDLTEANACERIGQACKAWGAFQVTNHGIPTSLLKNMEETCKNIFHLPMKKKMKAARKPDAVSGYGFARISSFFSKLMWSEGFTIVGSPLEHFRQLWPHDFTKHCDIIEEYEEEMQKLAGRLMWLMLGSLGIAMEDLEWAGPKVEHKEPCAALQLNHYPACPDPDQAMGLAAHTDSTLLTILYQNSVSGLQVQREGFGWVTIPPVPGALVVNVGDLVHILSNGSYPSALHRVRVNRTKYRLSVGYLYGPPSSARISPIPNLVGPDQPPLYRPITWNEYLGTKAKHFNKALSSLRVCAPLNGLIDVTDHSRVQKCVSNII